MTASACLIRTDVTSLDLLDEDGVATSWRFTSPPETTADSLELVQSRVNEASAWARDRLAGRHLELLCLDVSETRCQWLKAPSDEAPVLAASFRAASEDWGDLIPTGTLEAIRPPAGPTNGHAPGGSSLLKRLNQPLGAEKQSSAGIAAPVVHAPDTIARLWLDAMDRRGLNPKRVLTLWHAIALAWDAPREEPDEDQPLTGVIVLDEPEQRAVWSWSRGGQLVVGGHTALPMPSSQSEGEPINSPAADGITSRIALDWLSWASQIGALPDRVVLIGARADVDDLSRALGARWPSIDLDSHVEADPIGATLARAAQAKVPNVESAATCLLALTRRASRRTRRRYRWTAAALLLLASSLSITGYRLRAAGAELDSLGANERSRANDRADALGIAGISGRQTKVRALQSHHALLQSGPKLELPPSPPPVHSELTLALDAMQPFADKGDLLNITIDSGRSSQILFEIRDVRERSNLRIALEDLRSQLAWSISVRASQQTRLMMEGQW